MVTNIPNDIFLKEERNSFQTRYSFTLTLCASNYYHKKHGIRCKKRQIKKVITHFAEINEILIKYVQKELSLAL